MIKEVQIRGLYGLYDYDINFRMNRPVMILTGPNGFGKTTILKIINHLIKRNFWYFCLLYFKQIRIQFGDNAEVHFLKGDSFQMEIDFDRNPRKYSMLSGVSIAFYPQKNERYEMTLSRGYFMRTVRRYAMVRSGLSNADEIDFEDRLDRNYKPDDDDALPETFNKLIEYLTRQSALYVKEQRIRYDVLEDRLSRRLISQYDIEKIAEELKALYDSFQSLFADKCQEIDSKFVGKLISAEKTIYDKSKYDEKAQQVKDIIDGYQKFGLAREMKMDYSYKEEYREVLSQYIDDVYTKLEVYFPFYLSLSSFFHFIKDKELSNKTMYLDAEKGIKIIDNNDLEVPLRKLSSGEQNLIILYFNLLFKAKPGTILLVDEPENSIHAAWQESMLEDFKSIAKVFGIQIIVSTHSLEFIQGDWDSSIDLLKISGNEQG